MRCRYDKHDIFATLLCTYAAVTCWSRKSLFAVWHRCLSVQLLCDIFWSHVVAVNVMRHLHSCLWAFTRAPCEDYDPGIWWLGLKALALGLCSNQTDINDIMTWHLQRGQHLCRTVSLVKLWYHSWYLVKTRPWCWRTTLYLVLCTICANTTCVVMYMIMKSQRFHSNLDRAVYFRPLIWSWWVLLAIKWNTNCAHTCAAHNMPC